MPIWITNLILISFNIKHNNNSQYIYLKVPRGERHQPQRNHTPEKLEKAMVILKDVLNDLKELISMKAVK